MADHDGNRESATPQEVWNILRELSESQTETDRRMQETDRRMQETAACRRLTAACRTLINC